MRPSEYHAARSREYADKAMRQAGIAVAFASVSFIASVVVLLIAAGVL